MNTRAKIAQTDTGRREFNDDFGGTVSLPREDLFTYTGVRSEQLKTLTCILKEAHTGALQLGPEVMSSLVMLVGEFAHNVDALSNLCASEAAKARIG